MKRVRRVKLGEPLPSCRVSYAQLNNRHTKDWEYDYELVVSFHYGLAEEVIAKVAGLRNFDTGMMLSTSMRDLMFPCGTDKALAHRAAKRLWSADHFGALRIRISYPKEHIGKDDFTPWYSWNGKLIERVKHRKLSLKKVFVGKNRGIRKFRVTRSK